MEPIDSRSTRPPPDASAGPPRPALDGAAGGSARAVFEGLFLPLLPSAFRMAMTLTRNPSDAEDLLQDAALAAFRSFAGFTLGTSFKAWLYRILINRHYQRFRQQGRRPATLELEAVAEPYLYKRTAASGLHAGDDDPAGALLRRMTAEQVREAIAILPDEFRAAVSLYFLEDCSYETIASILDCPIGTVRSRLHRGRRLLQRLLWRAAADAGIVAALAGSAE